MITNKPSEPETFGVRSPWIEKAILKAPERLLCFKCICVHQVLIRALWRQGKQYLHWKNTRVGAIWEPHFRHLRPYKPTKEYNSKTAKQQNGICEKCKMTKEQNGKNTIAAITNVDQAKANGYTVPVFAEGDWYTLELLVKPTAALDEEFEAFDCEENRMVKVNGWLFTTHTE